MKGDKMTKKIKIGDRILKGLNDEYIVTDILGDEEFKAVPKYLYEEYLSPSFLRDIPKKIEREDWLDKAKETLDIPRDCYDNFEIVKII